MTVEELIAALTDGLTPDQAAPVRAAIERDAVKAKVPTWKQQNEYQALVDRQTALQRELEGEPDKQVYGAKAYKTWYDNNIANVRKLEADMAKYVEKYGSLENPTVPTTNNSPTKEEIMNWVRNEVLPTYAPATAVVNAMSSQMKVIQKHMLAGRKNPIDVDSLMRTAGEKYNGNLEQAYDEWDKPERERVAKEEQDKEVQRRVNEELQKRGASQHFPAGADLTPSALSQRSKSETDKFDRTNLTRDLAQVWLNGESETTH